MIIAGTKQAHYLEQFMLIMLKAAIPFMKLEISI